MSDITLLVHV